MNPLSATYGAAIAARNALYDRRVLPIRRLQKPVVSVGNLSAGGAGKTPFVIWLGQRLSERGIAYSILSRGYGRSSRGVRVVQPQGTAAEFGDEPLLLARALHAPVIVGESRFAAGLEAERQFPEARLHLLDDGFQHRALHRDFDLVLLRPEDLSDRLLPVGRLREPVRVLRRADALVIPAQGDPPSFASLGKPVWQVRRELVLEEIPSRPIAFCGIAHPQAFFAALRNRGTALVGEISFRDHHRYTASDVEKLQAEQRALNAGGFVTTEKDAINLGPLAAQLQPLTVVELQTHVSGEGDLLEHILGVIAERANCPV